MDKKIEQKRIYSAMRGTLREMPRKKINPKKHFTKIGYTRFYGKKRKKLNVWFYSRGCQHALSKTGPCTMCSYMSESAFGVPIKESSLIYSLKKALKPSNRKKAKIIELLFNGSFFNDWEFSPKLRKDMFRIINASNFRKIIIETRPEYISTKKIDELLSVIKNTELEVRMGLESSNSFIRNVCINKDTSLGSYNKAFKILKKYKQIRVLTYCLIKPPFLDEKTAIEDSVNTVRYAFSKGADTVSLKPLSVHHTTLVGRLYKRGLFKPPWLWSVIEVIRKTHNFGKVIIGTFEDLPMPEVLPRNCNKCSKKVAKKLFSYNVTRNLKELERLKCDCKREWRKELRKRGDYRKNVKKYLSNS